MSALAMSTIVNPFNPHWRQCAVMSERVVDKLLYNEHDDTFTIVFANGAYRTCKGDQLMPPLDKNDSITDMVETLRDDMRDMYYANMT